MPYTIRKGHGKKCKFPREIITRDGRREEWRSLQRHLDELLEDLGFNINTVMDAFRASDWNGTTTGYLSGYLLGMGKKPIEPYARDYLTLRQKERK